MKRQVFIRAFAAALVSCAALAAQAQIATAVEGASADELINLGVQTLRQIDAGKLAEVWEGGSAVLKTRSPRADFVEGARKARQSYGTATFRGWASVVRIRYLDNNSEKLPPGLYANIDFATDQAGGPTVYELVSFRLEPGGVWRLTGYVPRQKR